jgi:hypothetical protein
MVAASCSSTLLLLAGCATPGKLGAPASNNDEEVWSIRCLTLHETNRFERATAYADALQRVKGLRPELVQVLTDEDGTAVFYGRYQREYGPEGATEHFKPDQLQDLRTIRELSVRTGGGDAWPFYLAELDVLPTYRSAHPEWNLAQAEGYWSLHVAVFYNTEQFRSRRSAAEEYCALLREKGEEAYFHHGTVNSSVYVGLYPEGAVAEVRREDPLAGRMTTTLKMVDPRLAAAQERFPTSVQNGHTIYEVTRDHGGQVTQRTPARSFPVVIPKAKAPRKTHLTSEGPPEPRKSEPRPSGSGAFQQ